jgi:small subunit ribosomal protein S6
LKPYEMTYIVRPDLDEEQTRATVEQVSARITGAGGELIAALPWNPPRRRMAYTINDFGDGFYVTTVFTIDPQALRGVENALKLNDRILRFLLVQATDLNIKQAQQRLQQQAAAAAAPRPQPGPMPPASGEQGTPPGAPPVPTAVPAGEAAAPAADAAPTEADTTALAADAAALTEADTTAPVAAASVPPPEPAPAPTPAPAATTTEEESVPAADAQATQPVSEAQPISEALPVAAGIDAPAATPEE